MKIPCVPGEGEHMVSTGAIHPQKRCAEHASVFVAGHVTLRGDDGGNCDGGVRVEWRGERLTSLRQHQKSNISIRPELSGVISSGS